MAQIAYVTRGLPSCGKTTLANQLVANRDVAQHGPLSRLNLDDIRDELTKGAYSAGTHKWDPKFEKDVQKVFHERLRVYFAAGHDVVLDNTYLNPKTFDKLMETLKQYKVTPIIKDFRSFSKDTPVGVNECIRRDKERARKGERSVGIAVILRMWHDYIVPEIPKAQINSLLPDAIICDLDGTLADLNGRNPYDCSNCDTNDTPNEAVQMVLHQMLAAGATALFTSGRSAEFMPQTRTFLNIAGFYFSVYDKAHLFMRKEGDVRSDWVVKQEIYDTHIKGKYNILFCMDDRPQVVRQWQENGLPVFNVGNRGEF